MKAAVCEAPREISVRDVRLSEPGPDEVIVKVEVAGISDSDIKAYSGKHPEVIYPVIPGNEFSGRIAMLGEDVEGYQVGDGVIVEPLFPCGKCPACLSGNYNTCQELMIIGYHLPGAFAEYVVTKAKMLYPKDESLSFEEAALITPLSAAVHAVKRARVGLGDNVAVLGTNSIGLLIIQVASRSGAKVIAVDTSSEKLHLAANLGADYVVASDTSAPGELVMAATKGAGADVVIECTGKPENLLYTVNLVRKGGIILAVGWTGNESDSLPMTKITMNEISLLGSSTYCRDFPIAIELAISRDVNLSSIITHEFELGDLDEALEELSRDHPEAVKGIVRTPEEEEI
jgi:2-desacetyl-2-hydroxyethyl bacteriochlorophyllide A dehydrogenase